MKNLLTKALVLTFLTVSILTGQGISFTPSVYYTNGTYSDKSKSNSISLYSSIGFKGSNYLVVGYDQTEISNFTVKYKQKMLAAGLIKNLYPLYIKLNYAHINGTFSDGIPENAYDYFLNIYNVSLLYNYNLFFFGGSFSYINQNGIKPIVSKQGKLIINWVISPKTTLSVQPLYTDVSDGRELKSVYGEILYAPSRKIKFSIGGLVGERAYFFDDNQLTIFNQDETQKALYKAKLEYSVTNRIQIPLSFQYTEFETFDIQYFTIGLVLRI